VIAKEWTWYWLLYYMSLELYVSLFVHDVYLQHAPYLVPFIKLWLYREWCC